MDISGVLTKIEYLQVHHKTKSRSVTTLKYYSMSNQSHEITLIEVILLNIRTCNVITKIPYYEI